ncbi:cupin domain-containing protein [Amaricoccus sp.]|uniref:cupin domain-containing protein n=1 Tax=Amaricoccus sp. TaxID=1872485 RepID=UPI0025BDFE4D|nr:cupin domain-containing protein [Amaricoccus sp.]
MTTLDQADSHDAMQPEDSPALRALYAGFEAEHLMPLWTQIGDLMPVHPKPQAVPHVWKWAKLLPLAEESGRLVPVGRGGERRAIGLANPGLGGKAYITPTLWAAIQYLGPRETAPEHRHSQNAFRFVVEGEGVWTVVNGDPVRMSRGDFLLTPGWNFHGHHNDTDEPMAWIDGLDIPFSWQNDVGFFEFGAERVTDYATPNFSRSERLWCHPGLRPLSGLQDTGVVPDRRLPLGVHGPRADRAAAARGRGPARDRRAGPRRGALRQPDHRRRRDADDSCRVPPPARRRGDPDAVLEQIPIIPVRSPRR